ncbi:MAG: FtsW/RodA/SpoVE family cell cycle protein [Thiohalocapsa sp.]|jgi:cell division protein FtsW (lipid II flippase)|uniref:FtsW/RodA/SpoVE family cell cycle protein n=1 Tax=Thiohalocapsa sp. TaxID=2497641 RepID=UPI0025EE3DEC|nr:FtsW/RodA/SpoVE family cell cycle protein [Thiohalocapsa sp.]MCG6943458.1 FtsW/RodA/SpoVE family cell cycle protein [Thiohalocapsa sp.]
MAKPARSETFTERWDARAPERRLLLWVLFGIGVGFLMVLGALPKDGIAVRALDLLPPLGFVLSFFAAHALFVAVGFRGDQLMLALVAFLAGIGLLAQFRMGVYAGDVLGVAHLVLPVGVALLALVTVALMDGRYRPLAAARWFWAVLSLGIVVLVLVTGQRFRGAVYGAGFITPTEGLKLSVVLFTAAFIDRNAKALAKWRGPIPFPLLRPLWPLALFAALLLGLLLVQRDLGLVLILGLAMLLQLTAGTKRVGYLAYGALAASAAGLAVLEFFSHGQRRVASWLDPFSDPTGAGWQVLQGLSGMFAGGLWGEGFSQARPRYTPIAESDFIYAVVAEELGFIGSVLLLIFFGLLCWRLILIASRAKSPFGMLAATGIAAVFSVQTLLNVGGVTKAIPITGVTLPFISQGGSSLLTTCIALGVVLAISDGEPKAVRKKTKPATGGRRRRAATS